MPGIEALSLARSFGPVRAVEDASFSVPPGTVAALVGPNGSGKTTLLLMLPTLLRPDAGSVLIADHDVHTRTLAARARLGWMPDALGVWNTLTVREALVVVARMYGLRPAAARARADELLAMVGLGHLAGQRTHVLSRGQKQRLSLARALAGRPSVLLLDEPASGLDPAARQELRGLIRGLAADGCAVLVSSHVLDELEGMADAVIFMAAGRTAAPDEVRGALAQRRPWLVRSPDPARLGAWLAAEAIPATPESDLRGPYSRLAFADDAEAAQTLRRLVGAGVDIVEFAPQHGVLENAFVHLAAQEGRR